MKVAVIGGGITGLAAAWYLRRAETPVDVELFEAEDRVGGKIRTVREGSFLVEAGPDSFITYKPAVMALCRELGLMGDLMDLSPADQSVYVLRNGRAFPLPAGFRLTAPTQIGAFLKSPLVSAPGKLRMMMEPLVGRGPDCDDESVASFVRRRFGQECLERMAAPLMAGIYQADAETLSLMSTFPQLKALEDKSGSVFLGMRKQMKSAASSGKKRPAMFKSLRGGMESIVGVLEDRLGDVITRGVGVESMRRDGEGWLVEVAGEPRFYDRVVCTLAPELAAKLVMAGELRDALSALKTVPTATVSLGFKKKDLADSEIFDSYGLLAPEIEGRRIRSCTWSSIKLAERAEDDALLVRVFPRPELLADCPNDDALVKAVLTELADLVGIRATPVLTQVWRLRYGTPQYDVGHQGHMDKIDAAAKAVGPIAFCGCGYRGVGIADCIAQAKKAVDELTGSLGPVVRGA